MGNSSTFLNFSIQRREEILINSALKNMVPVSVGFHMKGLLKRKKDILKGKQRREILPYFAG